MKRITAIIFLINCFNSISVSAQLSWYKCLSGKIDKYDVTIHLHKALHQYSGYYYYNSTQQPVYFFGEDSTTHGKIKLTAVLPGRESEETFLFTLNENSCTGNWANSSGKTLSFSANEITQTPGWSYVFTTGSAVLRPKMKHSPEATYEAASVWPEGDSEPSTFLKKIINSWFANDTSATDIGQLFLKDKKQFFEDYLTDNQDVSDSDLADAYSFNMHEVQTINIAYQSPTLLTLANSVYNYSGGAHGNYGTSYISIDLKHNNKISIDHILSQAGKKQLSPLLEKHFRSLYGLKETDSLTQGGLFENKIEPNENFFITGRGIGFDYSPYEIGPYAMGEIVLFIPFEELSAYLQKDFIKL